MHPSPRKCDLDALVIPIILNFKLCLMAPEETMITQFLKDESGQDVVEYSLLLVLIGTAALFVLSSMGANISGIFSKINSKLSSANASITS